MVFITPAVKSCSISVSWHLETSLRTIHQKNLLIIASSNGEGVFSWLSVLPTVSGGEGVCVCARTCSFGKYPGLGVLQ